MIQLKFSINLASLVSPQQLLRSPVWHFHSSCHGSLRTCTFLGLSPFLLSKQPPKHAILIPLRNPLFMSFGTVPPVRQTSAHCIASESSICYTVQPSSIVVGHFYKSLEICQHSIKSGLLRIKASKKEELACGSISQTFSFLVLKWFMFLCLFKYVLGYSVEKVQ